MHPAVTTEDWSLMDCQEYFVDLEMNLAGVATALEVSAPGQLRDDQVGVYRELELEVGVARGLTKLRARHLEAYNLQGGPVAFADSSGIGKRLMMARMRLNEKLATNLPPDHAERTARMLLQRMSQEGGIERPRAPPPSAPEQGDSSEGAWPRFSGHIEDLSWFRQAWETHVRRFHHGLAPEVIVGGMRKYCMPRRISRMIEPARDPEEAWRIMESYFSRETRILDELIADILSHERMVNDSQTLAHYSRILMAIRDAKQIERLSDLLTDGRIKALMEIIPKKESNYWRQDQVGVRPKDMPVAFYSFVRRSGGTGAGLGRAVHDGGPLRGEPCSREMQSVHGPVSGGPTRSRAKETDMLSLFPARGHSTLQAAIATSLLHWGVCAHA
jgi:hypothetical protein